MALSLVGGLSGCASQPKFGTLPEIKLTYEADPPPPPPKPQEPPPAPPVDEHAPDPKASRTAEQVRLSLRFSEGKLGLVSFEAVRLTEPLVTPRRIGRFAAELWVGPELLDRVRFDVPLLGADAADPSLESGLSVDLLVLVPDLERARRLRLVDRKTRAFTELDWPLAASTKEQPSEPSEPVEAAASPGAEATEAP